MRRLTTLFPSEFPEEHAEELGVVERDRKLQIPVFVWAFVFSFAAGKSRTLAEFRRCYNSNADETISPSGFYQRLTPTLAEYLRDLVEAALDEVVVANTVDSDSNSSNTRVHDKKSVIGIIRLRYHLRHHSTSTFKAELYACFSTGMPTPHEVVEECFERMADDERRGTIDELFHDDATIRFPGATSEGPDAPTRMLEWLAPRYRWTEKAFDEWIVDGHRVFIRGTLHGVDPDGERLEGVRYVDICEVVDGRISRMDAYSDLLVKGVVPPET